MKLAEDALEILPSPRYWKKGDEIGGNGKERRCMVGAFLDAAGYYDWRNRDRRTCADEEAFQGLLDAAATIIREQFPERKRMYQASVVSSAQVISAFNDHPHTHYPDVRLVLEKLAAH